MSQTLQLLTSCDVRGCLALSTQVITHVALLDGTLPDGWSSLPDGKAACPRHTVQIVTLVDGMNHV